MRHHSPPLILVVFFLLPFLGCRASERPAAAAYGVKVIDDLGQQVLLAKPARRIVALSPSNVEILFAVGCGESLVLRDKLSSFPPQVKKIPATDGFRLSAEHIAGYAPDLVLLSHADISRIAALRALGIAVASFDPRTVQQVGRNIVAVGSLCGARRKALRLAADMQAEVQQIRQLVKGTSRQMVYVELDGSDPLKPWTAGPGSFVQQLIDIAGGVNVGHRLSRPYAQIGVEEVIRSKPQVAVLTLSTPGTGKAVLAKRPGWTALATLSSDRVVDGLQAPLLTRPGPRLVHGLRALAEALHPELRGRFNLGVGKTGGTASVQ